MPHLKTTNGNSSRPASAESGRADRENIFDAFRRWGYLQAQLDPLGRLLPDPDPELDIPGDVAEAARRLYCGRIGADFMHIPSPTDADGSRIAWRVRRRLPTARTFWSAS